jgi:hypothetical protein
MKPRRFKAIAEAKNDKDKLTKISLAARPQ